MRLAISVFAVLGLSLIGLYLAPVLAQAADITEIQAGLMTGAVITWAAFRIVAMLPDTQPEAAPTHQD
ncbi:hypothetical protein GCM10010275_30220 [Streptomyces litmocidini]|uniref:hypothetical protein n=1 Tax=Streptomyces litmocidini TaxID=67318 RepID=UPI00167E9B54|nr:hypothetical protein [Streptomyces litmocidini]GGU91109.1 hypothetical protein GCM10010275_30220 [Streptomyces litmocidini]